MKLLNKLFKSKEKSEFFGLTNKETKRVIKEAVRGSNQDQRELEEKYNKQFQKI